MLKKTAQMKRLAELSNTTKLLVFTKNPSVKV